MKKNVRINTYNINILYPSVSVYKYIYVYGIWIYIIYYMLKYNIVLHHHGST